MTEVKGWDLGEKPARYDSTPVLQQAPDAACAPNRPARTVWFHLKTLFLFIRSDFKTVIVPQSLFAVAAVLAQTTTTTTTTTTQTQTPMTPAQVAARLPHVLVYNLLHLLTENIANQRLPGSVVEDAANKPWRPLPAGRLTPDEARRLLRVVMPLAAGAAALLGAFTPSAALMALIWLYNDLEGGSAGPWVRNAINAAGLACFGWGGIAVLLAGGNGDGDGDGDGKGKGGGGPAEVPRAWLALATLVVTTTVHAQDFPDVEGDAARGRRSLPLVYGDGRARAALALLVLFWSVACPAFWGAAAPAAWAAPLCVGGAVAALTLARRGLACDELVWRLWCLWVAVLYLLPLSGRVDQTAATAEVGSRMGSGMRIL